MTSEEKKQKNKEPCQRCGRTRRTKEDRVEHCAYCGTVIHVNTDNSVRAAVERMLKTGSKYWLDAEVTVCSECLRASCWQDKFPCDKSRTANIARKTRRDLLILGREHPSYLLTDVELCQK